jgi:RNA polymerase sigma-70 factor (ECF subfamily)
MQRAIDELPMHFREALVLCEVEELSYREIAEILSIPIGTVMSRLTRARKAVRTSLRNNLALEPRSKGSSHRRNARDGFALCVDESMNSAAIFRRRKSYGNHQLGTDFEHASVPDAIGHNRLDFGHRQ